MRAFDQTGDVRQHEFATVGIHDAELRMQRGEGIVGDLRLGRADLGEEGRFAGIGQADEAGIRDQLQPQPDPALFAGLAGIGIARRAVGRGLEMRVAEAAIAALGQHEFFADIGEIVGIMVSRSSSKICVPMGTFSTIALPLAPWRSEPAPFSPFWALKCCW
ncbi:hypothetical protein ACVWW2_001074 [Bradyrhizobium sp. LM4.3]